QGRADANRVNRVTTKLAEMLAGAAVDGKGLVSPGWTGARIHPADVLEHVGPGGGALHFDGLPVEQINHCVLSSVGMPLPLPNPLLARLAIRAGRAVER